MPGKHSIAEPLLHLPGPLLRDFFNNIYLSTWKNYHEELQLMNISKNKKVEPAYFHLPETLKTIMAHSHLDQPTAITRKWGVLSKNCLQGGANAQETQLKAWYVQSSASLHGQRSFA